MSSKRVRQPVIETRGPPNGRCNICGQVGRLTEDHTPPKGCYKPTQVELQSLLRHLSDTTHGPKSRYSQNGVKYRTLCQGCNNTLLGANYDPAFIRFVNSVPAALPSSLALPEVLWLPGQPQAILRSLLGHLTAQGVDRYLKGPGTEVLRDYMLDTSLPLPGFLRVFYWAYPHQSHIMVRDAACVDIRQGKPFVMWFLKFFPIAFMVTWDGPPTMPFPVNSFEEWRAVPFDSQVDLPFRLRPLPPEHWPEAPTDDTIISYGREAINVRGHSLAR
jgi:hypothetical protein